MTTQSISVFTLEFGLPVSSNNKNVVDTSISFTQNISGNETLQTISSSGLDNSALEGMLYVPTLLSNDTCSNETSRYIPPKATRKSDIPSPRFSLVAVAPWISQACTKSYLTQASEDGVAAFIFFQASLINTSNQLAAAPPLPTDPAWSLGDSQDLITNSPFPIYGVNSNVGNLTLTYLALYSGDMADAPYADELIKMFDPSDFVRLYCDINVTNTTQLPNLWVFLLVVLGMLLCMIGITSLAMHFVQRRRRANLRNRIARGEVSLESLGIRRIKVPAEYVNKLPLSVYLAEDAEDGEHGTNSVTNDSASESQENRNETRPSASTSHDERNSPKTPKEAGIETVLPPVSFLPKRKPAFPQPTCPICLDDFVSCEAIVRTLPCKHVFHPACIDPLLREYSCLCPVCKAKVLPTGVCPVDVTNAMVRRERGMIALRERRDAMRAAQLGIDNPNARPNRPFWRRLLPARPDVSPSDRRNWILEGGREGGFEFARVELGDINVEANRAAAASASSSTNAQNSSPDTAASRSQNVEQTSNAQGNTEPSATLSQETTTSTSSPARRSGARPPEVPRSEWARRRASAMFGGQSNGSVAGAPESDRRPRWRRIVGTAFPMVA